MLKRCIEILNEVALDLTEPQTGANLEHQAKKVERVIRKLEKVIGDEPDNTTQVHGGGTGDQ